MSASHLPERASLEYVKKLAKDRLLLDWYASVGFKEVARYEDDGLVNFGVLSFGTAELMLTMHGQHGNHDVSLWFSTDHVDGFTTL